MVKDETMTMVERVARAIHFRGDDQGDDAWNHCQPWLLVVAREQARAAIEAMREPTEAMVEAGIAKDDELEWLQQDRAIPQVYTAMLDAALDQGEGR